MVAASRLATRFDFEFVLAFLTNDFCDCLLSGESSSLPDGSFRHFFGMESKCDWEKL